MVKLLALFVVMMSPNKEEYCSPPPPSLMTRVYVSVADTFVFFLEKKTHPRWFSCVCINCDPLSSPLSGEKETV